MEGVWDLEGLTWVVKDRTRVGGAVSPRRGLGRVRRAPGETQGRCLSRGEGRRGIETRQSLPSLDDADVEAGLVSGCRNGRHRVLT